MLKLYNEIISDFLFLFMFSIYHDIFWITHYEFPYPEVLSLYLKNQNIDFGPLQPIGFGWML